MKRYREPRKEYQGCFTESYAKSYADRKLSHTDSRGVNWYHCWREVWDDYAANPFQGELAKNEIIKATKMLRDWSLENPVDED